MKYIRTKDGIFELENERTITEFQVIDHLHNRAFLKDEILAQADTIEMLCDRIVIVDKKRKRPDENFISLYFSVKEAMENYDETFDEIYGAIWNDKGLIYVAKMDNEGKLCLI